MLDFKDTVYWVFQAKQKRRSATDIAVYSDLKGKLGDELPIHVEIKVQRTSACRRKGYDFVKDLIKLNPYEHADAHIRFMKYDPNKLLQKLVKRASRDFWKKAQSRYVAGKRESESSEKYRLALPRRVEGRMKRLDLFRVQMVKDHFPSYFRMLKPASLNALSIPHKLQWGALKHKGKFKKTVWSVDWSWRDVD